MSFAAPAGTQNLATPSRFNAILDPDRNKNFTEAATFMLISGMIGTYLRDGISVHTLIPDIKRLISERELSWAQEKDSLLAWFAIDELSKDGDTYRLPLYRRDASGKIVRAFEYTYYLSGDTAGADFALPVDAETNVYVKVRTVPGYEPPVAATPESRREMPARVEDGHRAPVERVEENGRQDGREKAGVSALKDAEQRFDAAYGMIKQYLEAVKKKGWAANPEDLWKRLLPYEMSLKQMNRSMAADFTRYCTPGTPLAARYIALNNSIVVLARKIERLRIEADAFLNALYAVDFAIIFSEIYAYEVSEPKSIESYARLRHLLDVLAASLAPAMLQDIERAIDAHFTGTARAKLMSELAETKTAMGELGMMLARDTLFEDYPRLFECVESLEWLIKDAGNRTFAKDVGKAIDRLIAQTEEATRRYRDGERAAGRGRISLLAAIAVAAVSAPALIAPAGLGIPQLVAVFALTAWAVYILITASDRQGTGPGDPIRSRDAQITGRMPEAANVKRLLIADDQPQHRQRVRQAYAQCPYIAEAADINEARRIVEREGPFDLVISDLDYATREWQKFWRKFRRIDFDGRRVPERLAGKYFVLWLARYAGENPAKAPAHIMLHSTLFEENSIEARLSKWLNLSGLEPLKKEVRQAGIIVRAKSETFEKIPPRPITVLTRTVLGGGALALCFNAIEHSFGLAAAAVIIAPLLGIVTHAALKSIVGNRGDSRQRRGENPGDGSRANPKPVPAPIPEAPPATFSHPDNTAAKVWRFIKSHYIVERVVEDGSIYGPTAYNEALVAFEELERRCGPLAGKRLLDFGAGDLRISLIGANLYGMKVTAVEKDRAIHAEASYLYASAKEQGLARNIDFIDTPTDALALDWRNFDVALFFYTDPPFENGKKFRQRLEEKVWEMPPHGIAAFIFVEAQTEPDRYGLVKPLDRFDGLKPLLETPLKISDADGGVYLQLYRAPRGFPDTTSPDGPSGNGRASQRLTPQQASDLRDITLINDLCLKKGYKSFERTLGRSVTLMRAIRGDSPLKILIERTGGTATGYIVYGPRGGEMYVHYLAVHPDHFRKGVGIRLIRKAARAAAEQKLPYLTLTCRKDNPSAEFYRNAGRLIREVAADPAEKEETDESGTVFIEFRYPLSAPTVPVPIPEASPIQSAEHGQAATGVGSPSEPSRNARNTLTIRHLEVTRTGSQEKHGPGRDERKDYGAIPKRDTPQAQAEPASDRVSPRRMAPEVHKGVWFVKPGVEVEMPPEVSRLWNGEVVPVWNETFNAELCIKLYDYGEQTAKARYGQWAGFGNEVPGDKDNLSNKANGIVYMSILNFVKAAHPETWQKESALLMEYLRRRDDPEWSHRLLLSQEEEDRLADIAFLIVRVESMAWMESALYSWTLGRTTGPNPFIQPLYELALIHDEKHIEDAHTFDQTVRRLIDVERNGRLVLANLLINAKVITPEDANRLTFSVSPDAKINVAVRRQGTHFEMKYSVYMDHMTRGDMDGFIALLASTAKNSGDTILNSADKIKAIIMAHDPDAIEKHINLVTEVAQKRAITDKQGILDTYQSIRKQGGFARIRRDEGKEQEMAAGTVPEVNKFARLSYLRLSVGYTIKALTYIAALSGVMWIFSYGDLAAKIFATIAVSFWLTQKIAPPLSLGNERNMITIETPDRILAIVNRIAAAGGKPCTVRIIDSEYYITNANRFTDTITMSSKVMNSLTDDELAMVIAHEVAHLKNGPNGFLINPFFWTLRNELEADRDGFLMAMKAGFDANGALSAVAKSGNILSGNAFAMFRNFLFYSSPLTSERIALIKSTPGNSGDTILNSADKVMAISAAQSPTPAQIAADKAHLLLGGPAPLALSKVDGLGYGASIWRPERPAAAADRMATETFFPPGYGKRYINVKTVVNPDNKPQRWVYGGAGADIYSFLLSTNAKESCFVLKCSSDLSISDFKKLEDSVYLKEGYRKYLDPTYSTHKVTFGYALDAAVNTTDELIAAIAHELMVMGISEVKVDVENGLPKIKFAWAYPNAGKEERSIAFSNADITKPQEYPLGLVEFLKEDIDGYYQRAGYDIPFSYSRINARGNFIFYLDARMKEGGFFVTDDFAYSGWRERLGINDGFVDMGTKFPLPYNIIAMPDAQTVFQYVPYGNVRIRQKPIQDYGAIPKRDTPQAQAEPASDRVSPRRMAPEVPYATEAGWTLFKKALDQYVESRTTNVISWQSDLVGYFKDKANYPTPKMILDELKSILIRPAGQTEEMVARDVQYVYIINNYLMRPLNIELRTYSDLKRLVAIYENPFYETPDSTFKIVDFGSGVKDPKNPLHYPVSLEGIAEQAALRHKLSPDRVKIVGSDFYLDAIADNPTRGSYAMFIDVSESHHNERWPGLPMRRIEESVNNIDLVTMCNPDWFHHNAKINRADFMKSAFRVLKESGEVQLVLSRAYYTPEYLRSVMPVSSEIEGWFTAAGFTDFQAIDKIDSLGAVYFIAKKGDGLVREGTGVGSQPEPSRNVPAPIPEASPNTPGVQPELPSEQLHPSTFFPNGYEKRYGDYGAIPKRDTPQAQAEPASDRVSPRRMAPEVLTIPHLEVTPTGSQEKRGPGRDERKAPGGEGASALAALPPVAASGKGPKEGDDDIRRFWEENMLGGFVYCGTNAESLPSIKSAGITPAIKNLSYDADDYAFIRELSLKAGESPKSFKFLDSEQLRGPHIVSSKKRAARYARQAPEKLRLFIARVEALIDYIITGTPACSAAISEPEVAKLAHILIKYVRKRDETRPLVLRIPVRLVAPLIDEKTRPLITDYDAFRDYVLRASAAAGSKTHKKTMEGLMKRIFNGRVLPGAIPFSPDIVAEELAKEEAGSTRSPSEPVVTEQRLPTTPETERFRHETFVLDRTGRKVKAVATIIGGSMVLIVQGDYEGAFDCVLSSRGENTSFMISALADKEANQHLGQPERPERKFRYVGSRLIQAAAIFSRQYPLTKGAVVLSSNKDNHAGQGFYESFLSYGLKPRRGRDASSIEWYLEPRDSQRFIDMIDEKISGEAALKTWDGPESAAPIAAAVSEAAPDRAANEGGFSFSDYVYENMPNLSSITDAEADREFENEIKRRFVEVNDKLSRENNVRTIINRDAITHGAISGATLPICGVNKSGEVVINTNFVKFTARLRKMGLNDAYPITDEDAGKSSQVLDSIIYSMILHELTGHFTVKDGSAVYIPNEKQAQRKRGTNYSAINLQAMLYFWFSLCENQHSESLRKRVRQFLKNNSAYFRIRDRELSPSQIAKLADAVTFLDLVTLRLRPLAYVPTGADRESIRAGLKKGYAYSDGRPGMPAAADASAAETGRASPQRTPDSERIQALRFADAIKRVKASKQGEPVILALGTSWIRGYERGNGRHYADMNRYIVAMRNYCRDRGVTFIDRDDKDLPGEIGKARESNPAARVIVLASEKAVTSPEFKGLRGDRNAFLAGVAADGLDETCYLRIAEMLRMALALGLQDIFADTATIDSLAVKAEAHRDFRNVYIFLPKAEKIENYDDLRKLYQVQEFA